MESSFATNWRVRLSAVPGKRSVFFFPTFTYCVPWSGMSSHCFKLTSFSKSITNAVSMKPSSVILTGSFFLALSQNSRCYHFLNIDQKSPYFVQTRFYR